MSLLVVFILQEGHTALYLAEVKQSVILITILRKITKVVVNKEVSLNRVINRVIYRETSGLYLSFMY